MTRPAALDRLVVAWRTPVDPATRRALFALVFAAALATAHIARLGTTVMRIAALGLLFVAGAFTVWVVKRAARAWRGVGGTIRRVLVPSDPALGRRALRAVNLVERTHHDSTVGSAELAHLHLERLIARASTEAVARTALRRAARLRAAFGVVFVGALVVISVLPIHVIEGFDVLAAHKGRAPVDLPWLDEVRVAVQPPAYLHGAERTVFYASSSSEPQGSVLTVRGEPVRAGRMLVLSDGATEVPFVSDGAGGVVARYTLTHDAKLTIAARFGEVLIAQPDPLAFSAERDRAPTVTLEGAPRRLALQDLHRLELRYTASDDYGLREVDLVLRSGGREDRRVLGRLDGETTNDSGGTVLYSSDRFLRKTFLPVAVTIEARDNDGQNGPKWGKSEAITIDPPVLGAPEAQRLAALQSARDALTDLIALDMSRAAAPSTADAEQSARGERAQAVGKAIAALRTSSTEAYGGLRVPAAFAAFLSGQAQRLSPAKAVPTQATRAEDVALAVDVAIRTLALGDAQSVARRLGDVAEEAADGALEARDSAGSARGLARLDVAIDALAKSSKELIQLGQLGADLGSVTSSELRRIQRSRNAKELKHAEIAARHLAARLRRPTPSFSASGRGGVESGSVGGGTGGGEASDAKNRFDEELNQLQELVQAHAQGIVDVNEALDEARRAQDVDSLKEEAKRRADSVRDAISGLPETGRHQSAAESSAGLAHDHAAAMAENLESVQFDRAVESGKDALEALSEAERKGDSDPLSLDSVERAEIQKARSELNAQLGWAQKQLDDLRHQAEERAKPELTKSGGREHELADRTRSLKEAGSQGQGALPPETTDALDRAEDLMRDAARELDSGHGEQGNTLQMDAQRWLEQSLPGSSRDPEESQGNDEGRDSKGDNGQHGMAQDAQVPKDRGSRATEDFRQRVLRGLSQAHGQPLSPAIRRYAERLLQ